MVWIIYYQWGFGLYIIYKILERFEDKNSLFSFRQQDKFKEILTCKELDDIISLKRVGDFGQIVQCKQLGIPLMTEDYMQILISIACCSSVIWSPDDTKILFYDGNNDCFRSNEWKK